MIVVDFRKRGKSFAILEDIHLCSMFRCDDKQPFAMTVFGFLMSELSDMSSPKSVQISVEQVAEIALDLSSYASAEESPQNIHLNADHASELLKALRVNVILALIKKLVDIGILEQEL